MAQVKLWTDARDLARRLNTTTDELDYFRQHRHQHLHEEDHRIGEKIRHFVVPDDEYKDLLRRIDRQLKRFELPRYFYGSQAGQSPVDCALVHLNSDYILKLDLKSFFPSTSYRRVRKALGILCSDVNVYTLITELCTYKYQLPQGFPTSPSISEIVLLPLARRIHGLCRSHGFRLSIYIDDVIISGDTSLRRYESRFRALFSEMRFRLNNKKSKMYTVSKGCAVTGVWLRKGTANTTPEFNREMKLLHSIMKFKGDTEFDNRLRDQLSGKLAWSKFISRKLQDLSRYQGLARN